MATILDNIGRGLAIGAQLGAGAKKRYGDLLEQNRRSLENRRFQEGLQRKSQLFQEEENFKSRTAANERFYANLGAQEARDEATQDFRSKQLKLSQDNARFDKAVKRYQLDLGVLTEEGNDLDRQILALRAKGPGEFDPAELVKLGQLKIDNMRRVQQLQNTEGQKLQLSVKPSTKAQLDEELRIKKEEAAFKQQQKLRTFFGESTGALREEGLGLDVKRLKEFGEPEGLFAFQSQLTTPKPIRNEMSTKLAGLPQNPNIFGSIFGGPSGTRDVKGFNLETRTPKQKAMDEKRARNLILGRNIFGR